MSNRVSFELERLRYCEAMYVLEKERKLTIERQAQFLLGVVTVFLGLLSFGDGSLQLAFGVEAREGTYSSVFVAIFGASLLVSLLGTVMVFAPRRRGKPYPKALVSSLFSDEWYTVDKSDVAEELQAKFVEHNARRYALAVERNSAQNTRQSGWLVVSAVSVAIMILSYALIITLASSGGV